MKKMAPNQQNNSNERLDRINAILDRTLATAERNEALLKRLLSMLEHNNQTQPNQCSIEQQEQIVESAPTIIAQPTINMRTSPKTRRSKHKPKIPKKHVSTSETSSKQIPKPNQKQFLKVPKLTKTVSKVKTKCKKRSQKPKCKLKLTVQATILRKSQRYKSYFYIQFYH